MGLSSLFEHWPNSPNDAWGMWANVIIAVGCHKWFDIYLIYWPPAIGCDYRNPDTMDWSVLIRAERTLLTDRCTEAPPWHQNIDIVVSLVTRVTRQCRVMLTPVTVIEINIRSEWVTNTCRDSGQRSQTAGARGTVRHAISESGSQEILHWPLFQGE